MSSIYSKPVCDLAWKQVGYSQYDGKHTKYAADLDAVDFYNYPKDGECDWCSIFVDWLIYQNTLNSMSVLDPDADAARDYLCEPYSGNAGAGCTQSANYFKSRGQFVTSASDMKCGDKIFFQRSDGAIYHTGIIVDWGYVEELGTDGFTVIEGNTNGGQVAYKYYRYDDPKIAGAGSIQYDGYEMPGQVAAPAPVKPEEPKHDDQDVKKYKVINIFTFLNVREGPGPEYKSIWKLYNNDIVPIYEIKNGWGRIDDYGWVCMDYLTEV